MDRSKNKIKWDWILDIRSIFFCIMSWLKWNTLTLRDQLDRLFSHSSLWLIIPFPTWIHHSLSSVRDFSGSFYSSFMSMILFTWSIDKTSLAEAENFRNDKYHFDRYSLSHPFFISSETLIRKTFSLSLVNIDILLFK
jgi:hypothetical protein